MCVCGDSLEQSKKSWRGAQSGKSFCRRFRKALFYREEETFRRGETVAQLVEFVGGKLEMEFGTDRAKIEWLESAGVS